MTRLQEKDIRPTEFTDGQKVAALIDVGRMLSRCAEFVDVACPACFGSESNHKYTKNGMQYVCCTGCDTIFITPRPTPEVLEWFYKDSPNYAYWNKHIFPASEQARREKIFVPRVDRLLEMCAKYNVSTDALLEVGAGFGTFCTELQSRGVFNRVVGVEPTPDLASTCRSRGIEVIESPVESIDIGSVGLFNVVASFEVIEHLFDPSQFVSHMLRLLKPGGLLILTCPNGKGFDIATLQEKSNSVDHEHLNYFNPSSLGRMLTGLGLQVVESFTPGVLDAELVRNKVIDQEISLDDQPFLKLVLIDEWERLGHTFQKFLINNNLSSNLWVVAKK